MERRRPWDLGERAPRLASRTQCKTLLGGGGTSPFGRRPALHRVHPLQPPQARQPPLLVQHPQPGLCQPLLEQHLLQKQASMQEHPPLPLPRPCRLQHAPPFSQALTTAPQALTAHSARSSIARSHAFTQALTTALNLMVSRSLLQAPLPLLLLHWT